MSSNAQALLQGILNDSGDSSSLTGKINKTKGVTAKGAEEMIELAYQNGQIDENDYEILKQYF